MNSTTGSDKSLAASNLAPGILETRSFTYPFDENTIRLWRHWATNNGHVAHGMDPDFLLPFLDRSDNIENTRLILRVRNDTCELAALVVRKKSLLFPNQCWQLFGHEHIDVSGFTKLVPGQNFDCFFDLVRAGLALENIALQRLHVSNAQCIEDGKLRISQRGVQYHAYFELQGKASYRIPARLNRNNRRLEKKLTERNGRLQFEIAPANAENTSKFFEIEALAWKGRAKTAISNDTRLQRIYLAACRHDDATSKACIAMLFSGDSMVASAFCLAHPDYILLLKIGYVPEFAEFSPGSLLLSKALDYAQEAGKFRLFLSTYPDWAIRWKPDRLEKQTVFVHANGLIGTCVYMLDRLLHQSRKLSKLLFQRNREA